MYRKQEHSAGQNMRVERESGAVLTEQRGKLGQDCLKLETLGLSRKYCYKILYLAPENHKAQGLLQCVSQIRSKIDFSLVFKVK